MDMRHCLYCETEIPDTAHWRQKFCKPECQRLFWQKKYVENNPFKGKTPGTTGAISELRAAIDLLSKGYDVFRALSPSCPCDLAVLINNTLLKIEVRTAKISTSGKIFKVRKEADKEIDHYAWVLPDKIIYDPPLP